MDGTRNDHRAPKPRKTVGYMDNIMRIGLRQIQTFNHPHIPGILIML